MKVILSTDYAPELVLLGEGDSEEIEETADGDILDALSLYEWVGVSHSGRSVNTRIYIRVEDIKTIRTERGRNDDQAN